MTVPMGGGHLATASVLKTLIARYGGTRVNVTTLDVITDIHPAFGSGFTRWYSRSVGTHGGVVYRVAFWIGDTCAPILQWIISVIFLGYARRKYAQFRPDLVISTFPFLGGVAVKTIDLCRGTAPVIVVVTDAGKAFSGWFTEHAASYLVATPDTRQRAIEKGVAPDRVRYLGFPVKDRFYDTISQQDARGKLRIPKDSFVVMVTAGGLGLNPSKVIDLVKHIATSTRSLCLIVVAGRNEALETTLRRVEPLPTVDLRIVGYTDKMAEYMTATDILCIKAGWLTISEAVTLQKPVIIYDTIPGQEEENVSYMVRSGFAVDLQHPRDVAVFLNDPERTDSLLRSTESSYRAAALADPREAVARHILSYLEK